MNNTACDDSLSSSDRSKANLLEQYAAKGQWEAVVKLVSTSHADDWTCTAGAAAGAACDNDKSVNDDSAASPDSNSSSSSTQMIQTPLHLALAYRAPVHVVDSLIQMLKQQLQVHVPEESQDDFGRTPLHVAVAAGCDEDTVERLLAGGNLVMPAVLRDEQDRTPLHVACASPVIKQKRKSLLGANQLALDTWNKRRVISVLLNHYPEAATLQDKTQKTPIDYAIANKFSKHSVHELQRAAEIYTPSMADPSCDDLSEWDVASMANSDVPLVVPSLEGSTRGPLTQESIANLESLLQEDWKSDNGNDDVSTLGDAEAELYNEIAFEGVEHS